MTLLKPTRFSGFCRSLGKRSDFFMGKNDGLKDLRKKYLQAAKVVQKFLESECCDEDKNPFENAIQTNSLNAPILAKLKSGSVYGKKAFSKNEGGK